MPPPSAEEAAAAPVYIPPRENPWRGRILGGIAFVALIIIAFVVGTFIHGFEPSEVKAAQQKPDQQTASAPVRPPLRSNVTLVPVSGDGGLAPIEQPITTAPPQTPGQQSSDATAMPESEYAAAAARAKAQQEAEEKAKTAMVDPRSLTGNAYDASQRSAAAPPQPKQHQPAENPAAVHSTETSTNAPMQPESAPPPARTPAILESRPLPHISTDHDITARLNLTVGPDGRVTGIDISDPVPDMGAVISAVQRWHFRPATENGAPVTSRVSVDITFHANE